MSVVTISQEQEPDAEVLREAIRQEYREVAEHPDKGFHFHTGRKLAGIIGCRDDLLACVPADLPCHAGLRGGGTPGAEIAAGPPPGARGIGCHGCGALSKRRTLA